MRLAAGRAAERVVRAVERVGEDHFGVALADDPHGCARLARVGADVLAVEEEERALVIAVGRPRARAHQHPQGLVRVVFGGVVGGVARGSSRPRPPPPTSAPPASSALVVPCCAKAGSGAVRVVLGGLFARALGAGRAGRRGRRRRAARRRGRVRSRRGAGRAGGRGRRRRHGHGRRAPAAAAQEAASQRAQRQHARRQCHSSPHRLSPRHQHRISLLPGAPPGSNGPAQAPLRLRFAAPLDNHY